MAQSISFNYHSVFLKMLVDGGYVTFGVVGTPKYHFYQNDHLGNVRVVSDANGTVEEGFRTIKSSIWPKNFDTIKTNIYIPSLNKYYPY